VQRSRILFSLVVALFLSTVALADPIPVTMTLLYTGSNNSGGVFTYPYYFSINGGAATPLMCDSFTNHVSVGETWTADVTGLLSGKGLYGNKILDYKAAGILFLEVVSGKISANDGNWAVWNLFTSGITNDPAVLALDLSALAQAKTAKASYFKGLVLYTPVGASPGRGPQEYIGFGNPMATPEPGTLLMLGTGLVGIGGMMRRKLLRS
jgi:hypothetical protein